MNDLRTVLASRVKQARAALGVSQDELAARAGLHRTFVGGIERGERNISLGSLQKIAGALGVAAATLIDEDSRG